MVERLITRADTGAVTGYRWLFPERHSLANLVLYSLNTSIATLFTSGGHHLLWGGCWAIRRELFDRLRIRDAWQGVLSDDLAVSRVIHRAGLRIKFEPSCMLATPWDGGTAGMFDFLYRQHFMLWRYAPRWSLAMLAATLLTVCGFWCPAGYALLFQHHTGQWPLAMLALLGLVYGLQVGRGVLRVTLASRYFPEHCRALAPAAIFDVFAGPLTAAVSLSVMLAAAFGRRVRWRQISYIVDADGTVVSARHAERRQRAAGRTAPLGVPARA
jgi:cellulose synthase/poly-beta-1,6-N-acetylglucosamine synthase-like glycosyltransferase